MFTIIYREPGQLFIHSILISIPLIITGFQIPFYFVLDHKRQDLSQFFFIGCGCTIFLQKLVQQTTKGKLILVNLIQIVLAIIMLCNHNDKYQTNFIRVLILILGLVSACNFQLTISYLREVVGWEEQRAVYFNNIPYIHIMIGIVIFYSSEDFRHMNAYYYGIILSNLIRMIGLQYLFNKQSIVYYYRRYEELKGSIVINKLYKGRTDEIEYFHISNNELQYELNLNFNALLRNKKYQRRFIVGILINLFSWIQLNIISSTYQLRVQYYKYLISLMILVCVISTTFLLRIIQFRVILIINQIILLIVNLYFAINTIIGENNKIINNIISLLTLMFFSTYLVTMYMYTTQILPQKGITFSINCSWISLLCLYYLYQNQDEIFYECQYSTLIFFLLSLISIIGIFMGKEVCKMSEQKIQDEFIWGKNQ